MIKSNDKKNKYRQIRESLDLTREQASELLACISPERIERIENEKFLPTPEEVRIMARGYMAPELCNYYCANQCAIGEKTVNEVKTADISQIVLEMIDSLNTVEEDKNNMIHIAVDGSISDNEIPEFIKIQENLEKISATVDSLKLWTERMKTSGKINKELYEKYKSKK